MKTTLEYKEQAKREQMALFHITIDRRHISHLTKGGKYKHESSGVMSLDKAARIMAILREED
jgi:hypothetical protein